MNTENHTDSHVTETAPLRRKMLLTLDFPPAQGGIQNYLYSIAMHSYTEHDIIITPFPKTSENGMYSELPCKVIRIPYFSHSNLLKLTLAPMFFITFFYLLRYPRTTIYCGNIYTALITRLLSTFFHTPYHCYTYGTELLQNPKRQVIRTYLWKCVLRKAEKVYYLSETTKKLLNRYITINTNLELQTPKIDLPAISTFKYRKKNNSSTCSLLSVGRLVAHKGHATLISALAQLVSNVSTHVKCTIVGNGPEYSTLQKKILFHTLTDTVSLLTDCNDEHLRQLYSQSDIFIFPSFDSPDGIEGFGIVLIEAMSFNCAIISSDCSASKDVFKQKPDAALFFPSGNADKLCSAIIQLLHNPSQRHTLAEKGFRLLQEHYAW